MLALKGIDNMFSKIGSVGFLIVITAMPFGAVNAATVGVVVGAVGATINDDGGPEGDGSGGGYGSISATYNQSGLFKEYKSGVTDFDTFVASTLHDDQYLAPPEADSVYTEWFSESGEEGDFIEATVTYDLGAVLRINKMALWNEDYSGIGTLNLLTSVDGSSFSMLKQGLQPTNNLGLLDYGADVFSFDVVEFQFIRLEASGCSQAHIINPEESITYRPFYACGIGEVAFSAVPLPGAGFLLIGSLGGLGLATRRRRSVTAKA